MARKYPRFLFSDPQNTKSPGPFIIHTIYPRGIFRVFQTDGKVDLEILEFWEPEFKTDADAQAAVIPLLIDVTEWLSSQIKSRQIQIFKLPDDRILVKSGGPAFRKTKSGEYEYIPESKIKRLGEEYMKKPQRDSRQIYHEPFKEFVNTKELDGECCCDQRYDFPVYDWEGKVHCVHCRLPLLKN